MDNSKVIRSVGLIGSLTLLSRGLGLVRDMSMAAFFGTSLPMSAFVVAFTIPNLFRRLFGEGALSSAFVPVFVESRQKDGDDAAWLMARKVISLTATLLLIIFAVGWIAVTVAMQTPLGPKAAMILPLLRIMLPYMVFICLAALSMATLNSFHHFAVPAATPCLLNIIWIATVLLICPRLGESMDDQVRGVAWGVLVAGVVQLAVQIPVLLRYGYQPGWSLDWRDQRVVRVVKLMLPAALGLAVTQVNVLVDRLLAIWVGAYAPAALFYSERLIYFPLGIFATSLGTVLLPVFSGQVARDDPSRYRETINHSLRNLLFIMVPASVGLLVLARPIVQMIFEVMRFTPQSTSYTAVALQFYAPGLLVFSLAKVFVPAFYARQDTRTPVKVGLCTVALNLVLNVTFILTWPQPLKHAGIACATVLAEAFYSITLAVLLHRRIGSVGWRAIGASILRCLVAAVCMGIVAVMVQGRVYAILVRHHALEKLAQISAVMASIIVAMAVYLVLTRLLRSPELKDIGAALRKKRG